MRQSSGICSQLKVTIKIGRSTSPSPILIRFLSKTLFDSFTNLVMVKPNPQVYTKNNAIVKGDILLKNTYFL
ncbi:hypothetical protein KY366_05905 [Candidatus Woesearchaeota archaeon]|nr:hypothetical protein [Candidatus Woesearchaeota archaeon]